MYQNHFLEDLCNKDSMTTIFYVNETHAHASFSVVFFNQLWLKKLGMKHIIHFYLLFSIFSLSLFFLSSLLYLLSLSLSSPHEIIFLTWGASWNEKRGGGNGNNSFSPLWFFASWRSINVTIMRPFLLHPLPSSSSLSSISFSSLLPFSLPLSLSPPLHSEILWDMWPNDQRKYLFHEFNDLRHELILLPTAYWQLKFSFITTVSHFMIFLQTYIDFYWNNSHRLLLRNPPLAQAGKSLIDFCWRSFISFSNDLA